MKSAAIKKWNKIAATTMLMPSPVMWRYSHGEKVCILHVYMFNLFCISLQKDLVITVVNHIFVVQQRKMCQQTGGLQWWINMCICVCVFVCLRFGSAVNIIVVVGWSTWINSNLGGVENKRQYFRRCCTCDNCVRGCLWMFQQQAKYMHQNGFEF